MFLHVSSMGQGFGFHKQSTEGRASPVKGDGKFVQEIFVLHRHHSSIGMQADTGDPIEEWVALTQEQDQVFRGCSIVSVESCSFPR